MARNGHRCRSGLETLGAGLVALALLAPAAPASAGQAGNLQPVGTLLLELDATTSQFRLDDGDGDASDDRVQLIFDRKIIKPNDACLVGLTPPDPPDPNSLVSLEDSPTAWGIDTGKLALGGRTKKGNGCGQVEFGEISRLEVNSLLLTDTSIQVEAKQNASARVTLILDDGTTETVVGTRYLLSGRAVDNPPAEVAAAPPGDVTVILANRPDGGPDSGQQDDGFWVFSAPFHNVEVYEILTNSDGTQGKLSIKGGGEFPIPSANRSTWLAFEPDGLLACSDPFATEGVTGNRTNEGTCVARVPYELGFDGEEVTFNVLDTANQGAAYAFRVRFDSEAAAHPIDPTILSYDPAGVDCTGVDLQNGPFTEACIPLTLCLGTPIRRCSNDLDLGCQEDIDCGTGNSCRLVDLLPPAGGFPDLVEPSNDPADTDEYGCVCEEDVLYLGPGLCDDGSSCEQSADCTDGSTCQDQIAVDQCLFAIGDLKMSRKTR